MKFLSALLALLLYASAGPAQAQLLLTGVGASGVVASGFSVTLQAPFDSGSINTATPSTGAINIGAADNHRLVVAALASSSGAGHALTGLTFNGTNVFSGCFISDSSTKTIDLCEALVTTGTTVTIVATYSGNVTRFSTDVWTVLNASGDAHSARSGAAPNTSASSPINITTIATSTAAGYAIAAVHSNTTSNSVTWSSTPSTSGSTGNHSNGTVIQMSTYTVAPGNTTSTVYTATQAGGPTLLHALAATYN